MKKNTIILLIVMVNVFSCLQKPKTSDIIKDGQNSSSIKDSVFVSPNGGYGYAIIMNGRVIIHQPHMPIVSGNAGFVSAEEARKTALLVINKIKYNQFPPKLSRQDLKDLEITFDSN
ncbi:hypothetical protein WSM22_36490 [Cytophagales bacterium WSM2-2]|nr:hypothetical protein WSM22_36490 [Cytophagales bacterium WSM2-2]